MPVPAVIRAAAENFRMNTHFVDNAVKDLSPEEWMARPNDHSNHMMWVVGHIIWARGGLLGRLGTEWSKPWFALFVRGAQLKDSAQYPTPEQVMEAWKESSELVRLAIENVPDELLSQDVKQPAPPTADGKNSGLVNFLIFHETYHVGQVTYLRSWLGKSRLMG